MSGKLETANKASKESIKTRRGEIIRKASDEVREKESFLRRRKR